VETKKISVCKKYKNLMFASQNGGQASVLCRKREIDIEQIYDPRFGCVGLYPESVLIEVFK
jgi:hypothetical protein